jgi:hypothetical protein
VIERIEEWFADRRELLEDLMGWMLFFTMALSLLSLVGIMAMVAHDLFWK